MLKSSAGLLLQSYRRGMDFIATYSNRQSEADQKTVGLLCGTGTAGASLRWAGNKKQKALQSSSMWRHIRWGETVFFMTNKNILEQKCTTALIHRQCNELKDMKVNFSIVGLQHSKNVDFVPVKWVNVVPANQLVVRAVQDCAAPWGQLWACLLLSPQSCFRFLTLLVCE